MSWSIIWIKIKKTVMAAGITLLLMLFFVLLFQQKKSSPQNPMDQADADASRMYLTASTLAVDESLLHGIENANIHVGDSRNEWKETEEVQEQTWEENREQIQEAESEQPQDDQEQITTDFADNLSSLDSLLSLIQKKEDSSQTEQPDQNGGDDSEGENGDSEKIPSEGVGGQNATLTPEASGELFTTSIVDGERVTDPSYYFTITLTQKGKMQNLVSQTVTVNGTAKSFYNGDRIVLKEGANTIIVTLRFRDKNYNQIDAPTKSYTIYYVPENTYFLQVQNADTNENYVDGDVLDVYEPVCNLRVIALRGAVTAGSRMRLNNGTVSLGEDGIYHLNLKVGTNTIKVTAGTGVNQQVLTFCLNYQPGVFTLTMESDAVTEKIQGDQFGKSTYVEYTADSDAFSFRISCSKTTGIEQVQSIAVTTHLGTTEMVNMASASGYISCTLDATGATKMKVTCLDSEGSVRQYTWEIKYIRSGATPEGKKPIIQTNLAEGEVLKSSPYILTVHGKDYQGKQLYPSQMQIYLNGSLIEYSGISGIAYEYFLYLQEGTNLVQIIASDTEQYRAVKEIAFTYDAVIENVDVTLLVDANVVGLGSLIQERLSVPSNTTIAQFLEDRLIAHGYTPSHLGSTTGDYYLRAISKTGILNNWSISVERQNQLIEEGYGFSEPSDLNKLGEFDFSQGSGWMITLNDYFIGMGMGTRTVRDGDVVHIQFTLSNGSDVGVDPNAGIYG